MKRTPVAGQQLSFDAELENWAEGMDYCAVSVPTEVTQALGTRGPVLVEARVNESRAFPVSLFPVGGGQHCIRIKASVRKETNTRVGDRIRIRIVVVDPAAVEIPDDLMKSLRAEDAVQSFNALPPGRQNFLVRRIGEAATPGTRAKRIQEAVAAAHQRRDKLLEDASTKPRPGGATRRTPRAS